MSDAVLTILTDAFGDGKKTTRDNYIFHCPVCQHRKPKLEIGIESHKWHCWVCNNGGHNLYSLIKWSRVGSKYLDEIGKIVGHRRYYVYTASEDVPVLELPSDYKPLWIPDESNPFWKLAIKYVSKRGLTPMDVLKYRIGYCDSGVYDKMLIIPNYNPRGELTYFVTRAYMETVGPKFKNPDVPKDVIGFDWTINWSEPIVIVESALDAMTVRRNAVPLFGKSMSDALRDKVLHERLDTVYICLDADAIVDAINHISFFLNNGIGVYLTRLPEGEDPSSLGFDRVWECIEKSEFVTTDSLFKLRVEDHLYGGGKTYLPHRRRSLSSVSKTQRVSGSFR